MTVYNESAGGSPAGPLGRLKLGQAQRAPFKPTDTTEQGAQKKANRSNTNLNGLKGAAARRVAAKAKTTPGPLNRKTNLVGSQPQRPGPERPTYGPVFSK